MQNQENYFVKFSSTTNDSRNNNGINTLQNLASYNGKLIFNSYVNEFGNATYSFDTDFKAKINNPFIYNQKRFIRLLDTEMYSNSIFAAINQLEINSRAVFFNEIINLALLKRGIYLLETLYFSNSVKDKCILNLTSFLKTTKKIQNEPITFYYNRKKRFVINAKNCIASDALDQFNERLNYLIELDQNCISMLGNIFKKHIASIPFNSIKSRNTYFKELYFYCYSFIVIDRKYAFDSSAFNRRNSDFFRKYVF
ncbi:hypothetical protein [Flavobacterium sp.]|uniref:hypothetical protein n=1 Tax=Flavobacterium sp. TaxID=239 RepID=UPI00262884C6|nr:hypothetical protein [Flavobacterium sp.]